MNTTPKAGRDRFQWTTGLQEFPVSIAQDSAAYTYTYKVLYIYECIYIYTYTHMCIDIYVYRQIDRYCCDPQQLLPKAVVTWSSDKNKKLSLGRTYLALRACVVQLLDSPLTSSRPSNFEFVYWARAPPRHACSMTNTCACHVRVVL